MSLKRIVVLAILSYIVLGLMPSGFIVVCPGMVQYTRCQDKYVCMQRSFHEFE